MNKLLYESRWSEGKHSPVDLAVERKSRFKISDSGYYYIIPCRDISFATDRFSNGSPTDRGVNDKEQKVSQ